jgi:hypothetical protein
MIISVFLGQDDFKQSSVSKICSATVDERKPGSCEGKERALLTFASARPR